MKLTNDGDATASGDEFDVGVPHKLKLAGSLRDEHRTALSAKGGSPDGKKLRPKFAELKATMNAVLERYNADVESAGELERARSEESLEQLKAEKSALQAENTDLRDRLQRCEAILSTITGLANDYERSQIGRDASCSNASRVNEELYD